MLCREVVKQHAKTCKKVCCAYIERLGEPYCAKTITHGPEAECAMEYEIKRAERFGKRA